MPALIETISPGRARAGDTLTINGSGFGSFGNNAVRVDDGTGFATVPGADVTTIDASTIEFVVPAGLARDRFFAIEVTNNEDDTASISFAYSQLTVVELETNRLPVKKPGAFESVLTVDGVPDENPLIQEAKDWDRLATKSEMAQRDLFTALGDLAARGAIGMRRIPIGADEQRYFRDAADGSQWKTLEPEIIWWAGQIPAATVTEEFLLAHADAGEALPSASGSPNQLVAVTGKLALLTVHVTDESTGSVSRIVRVRILVEDVEVFDSASLPIGQDPFINKNGQWTLAPWIDVTAGDSIKVAVTKNSATNTLNVIARGVIV